MIEVYVRPLFTTLDKQTSVFKIKISGLRVVDSGGRVTRGDVILAPRIVDVPQQVWLAYQAGYGGLHLYPLGSPAHGITQEILEVLSDDVREHEYTHQQLQTIVNSWVTL